MASASKAPARGKALGRGKAPGRGGETTAPFVFRFSATVRVLMESRLPAREPVACDPAPEPPWNKPLPLFLSYLARF